MRIGYFGGTVNDGTIDDVVAEARQVEADGFASYWAPAGTITWCTGPNTLADDIVPTINAAAEAAERPVPRVVAALPVCVTNDFAGAKARAAKVFEIYGTLPSYRAMLDREGAAGPEDVAITGTEAEVTERIAALADVGVTEFAAVGIPGNPDEATATRAAIKTLIG